MFRRGSLIVTGCTIATFKPNAQHTTSRRWVSPGLDGSLMQIIWRQLKPQKQMQSGCRNLPHFTNVMSCPSQSLVGDMSVWPSSSSYYYSYYSIFSLRLNARIGKHILKGFFLKLQVASEAVTRSSDWASQQSRRNGGCSRPPVHLELMDLLFAITGGFFKLAMVLAEGSRRVRCWPAPGEWMLGFNKAQGEWKRFVQSNVISICLSPLTADKDDIFWWGIIKPE